jgi:ABC-type phosphate/phosphonate transport system substrate-binding protein
MPRRLSIFGFVAALACSFPAHAAEYVFSAPPRETPERAQAIYAPIAEFLTQATGETFRYEFPPSWPTYAKQMKTGQYDLVFDGPHFVSWRIDNIQYDALVKLPQPHVWTIIARADDPLVNNLQDLEAKKICAPASPNFGTLTWLSSYSNPVREPVHVITKSWRNGFDGVMSGKCFAAVLPKTNRQKFDPEGRLTKVVHTYEPHPNQAFTAGPQMSENLKRRVQQALLSPEGQAAMGRLRERFTNGAELISADNAEYAGVSRVLDRAVGFGVFAY